MTKEQFLSVVKSQNDAGFLKDIIKICMAQLPGVTQSSIAYEMYCIYAYEGELITLVHEKTGQEISFAGRNDAFDYLHNLRPVLTKNAFIHAVNGNTLMGYKIYSRTINR